MTTNNLEQRVADLAHLAAVLFIAKVGDERANEAAQTAAHQLISIHDFSKEEVAQAYSASLTMLVDPKAASILEWLDI